MMAAVPPWCPALAAGPMSVTNSEMSAMTVQPESAAHDDEEGRGLLHPAVVSRCDLSRGDQPHMVVGANGAQQRQPGDRLAKVYVEPTNRCNLECRTCIRHGWDEPLGQMDEATFARITDGLRAFSPPPTVFFGGFGEPLAHPRIVEMVAKAKALGGPAELITNGTLLTQDVSRRLISAGLDLLWVSLDGATPESYTDVRLGAALPQVLANLAAFRDARAAAPESDRTPDRHRFCDDEAKRRRPAGGAAPGGATGGNPIHGQQCVTLHQGDVRGGALPSGAHASPVLVLRPSPQRIRARRRPDYLRVPARRDARRLAHQPERTATWRRPGIAARLSSAAPWRSPGMEASARAYPSCTAMSVIWGDKTAYRDGTWSAR